MYGTKEKQKAFYLSKEWRQLRESILERDNYECQWCKEEGKVTTNEHAILEVDHIKELEDYPELATDKDNLRTLCRTHHNKRHNRFEWKPRKGQKWENLSSRT